MVDLARHARLANNALQNSGDQLSHARHAQLSTMHSKAMVDHARHAQLAKNTFQNSGDQLSHARHAQLCTTFPRNRNLTFSTSVAHTKNGSFSSKNSTFQYKCIARSTLWQQNTIYLFKTPSFVISFFIIFGQLPSLGCAFASAQTIVIDFVTP